MTSIMTDVRQLIEDASTTDPALGLRAALVLRRIADEIEQAHVERARAIGWSWQEIGDALGITRQAAHKKYRRR